jgi:hypothetical protein
MEFNSFVFPKPSTPTYNEHSFPNEYLIKIPKKINKRNLKKGDEHIPCLFFYCHKGSDKLMIYFHGNAEDLSISFEFYRKLSE